MDLPRERCYTGGEHGRRGHTPRAARLPFPDCDTLSPSMPPALCAHCGAFVSVNALTCPNCRHRSLGRMSHSRSGLFGVSSDAMSRFGNRVAITILISIVALTWFAVVEWSKDSHEVRDSFEAQIQCEIILEHGEEFEGELAACQRQVAYLRAMEHR